MKLLEVIVTSVDEACEAEQGGADRLELVSDFASEGLTPKLSIVERVLRVVSIPVRVMLRENESFEIKDDDELELLKKYAAELGSHAGERSSAGVRQQRRSKQRRYEPAAGLFRDKAGDVSSRD